jgi:hypothetical protein
MRTPAVQKTASYIPLMEASSDFCERLNGADMIDDLSADCCFTRKLPSAYGVGLSLVRAPQMRGYGGVNVG